MIRMLEVARRLKDDGFVDINSGLISANNLRRLISTYFNIKEDLSRFRRRNGEDGLELQAEDKSRGYVFVGPLQLDRDYEARMQKIRKWYSAAGRYIQLCFVDFKQDLAGFSWRQD